MKYLKLNSTILVLVLSLCLIGCKEEIESAATIGYVEAQWLYVSASQSGYIVERLASEGQNVEEGDPLFRLDEDNQLAALAQAQARLMQSNADVRNLATGARPAEIRALEARLAELQARLTQAESELERVLPLVARGIETVSRGESVQANFDMAQSALVTLTEEIVVAKLAARDGIRDSAAAALQMAQAQKLSAEISVAERTVSATAAGRVEESFRQVGEFIQAGSPVFAILPDDGLKIKFFVNQDSLSDFTLGQTVIASADGTEESYEAVVSYISTQAEFTPPVIYSNEVRSKLVFLIEATLSPAVNLRPGLPVDVDWS